MASQLDPLEHPDPRLGTNTPETADDNESVEGGATSDRPIEEEQRDQQNLPPRGDNEEVGHA